MVKKGNQHHIEFPIIQVCIIVTYYSHLHLHFRCPWSEEESIEYGRTQGVYIQKVHSLVT